MNMLASTPLSAQRLDAQRRTLQMANLGPEEYGRILRLLTLLCAADAAWIALLGPDGDLLLEGLDIPAGPPPTLAQRTMDGEGLLECDLAGGDPALHGHPWSREHGLGWLASYPLTSPEGHAIGCVAVAAATTRALDISQRLALVDLVSLLETEMRLRFLLSTQPQTLRQHLPTPGPQGGLLGAGDMTDLLHYSYTRCRLEQRPYALALVELDAFHQLDLTEDQADILQQAAVSRLLRCLRLGDLVGAWADRRLLVLLPGVDADELYSISDKLVKALDDKVDCEGQHVSLAASIGLVGIPQPRAREQSDLLVLCAEHALQQAIEAGRHRARLQLMHF